MRAEDFLVASCIRFAGWDDDSPTSHEFLAVTRGEHLFAAIPIPFHQLVAASGDDAVGDRNHLSSLHAQEAEPSFAGLLHEVPVGWDPCRRRLLAAHRELAARCVELVGLLAAGTLQSATTAAGHAGREQIRGAIAHPEPVVGQAHDDVRNRVLRQTAAADHAQRVGEPGDGVARGIDHCDFSRAAVSHGIA